MSRLALLALILVAWVAAADHAYSHRFVFEGRLIGSDGAPLPGKEVSFFATGDDLLAPCREGPQQSITDASGDFRFCYHHHDLKPGARVGIRVGNATVERPADIAFRRSVVNVREPNETGVATPEWNRTFRISGRAWMAGPTELEGVAVYGIAVIGIPVNLTVHASDGTESVFRTTTDGYGDFDLVLETEDPANVSVSLEANGLVQPAQLERTFHRTYAPIYVAGGLPRTDGGTASPFGEGSSTLAPGSTTPRFNPVLGVALALGLVVAILLSRRKNV